eukprot:PhF_6_TR11686/c0_g1_i1/m.18955
MTDTSSIANSMTSSTLASKSGKKQKDAHKRAGQMDAQTNLYSVKDGNNDVTPIPLTRKDNAQKKDSLKKARGGGGDTSTSQSQSHMSQSHVSQSHASQSRTSQSDRGEDERSVSRATTESDDAGASVSSLSEDQEYGADQMGGFQVDGSLESSQDSKPTGTEKDKKKDSSDPRDKKKTDQQKPSSPMSEKRREMTTEERSTWENAEVSIVLTETPTFFIFEKPDEAVVKDTPEAEAVKKRNQQYKVFRESIRGSDRYASRGMTTINRPFKAVETQYKPPAGKPCPPIQVVSWKMDEELNKLYEDEQDEDIPAGAAATQKEPGDGEGGGEGGGPDEEASQVLDEGDGEGGGDASAAKKNAWLMSSTVMQTLMVVERIIVGNIYEDKQLEYRGIVGLELDDMKPYGINDAKKTGKELTETQDRVEDDEESREKEKEKEATNAKGAINDNAYDVPTMTRLWRYGCDVTANKNVSCLSWNNKNHDILAVGYGEFGSKASGAQQKQAYGGFVCCWSLKNPVYPERIIRIESSDAGVSSLHFSKTHPALLAVGNTDGTLALYDVRKHGNTPALKTTVSTGQHTGTIWEVRWVEKGKGENLVSISADGRVAEWSIKKGLERTAGDLMKLKRQQNQAESVSPYAKGDYGRATEALLSRESGGMCVDFHRDGLFYIVGTEDGTIHKCTRSQRDQYVMDYKRHEEPVYRVRWSPFCRDYFLSCSADWTSRLYHHERVDPILSFQSRKEAIHDISWSPTVSTVFVTATASGRVCLWDIAESMNERNSIQPNSDGRSLNCLLFADQVSPVVAAGDNKGDVTIVKLGGKLFNEVHTPETGSEKMLEALKPNMK